VLDEVVPAAVVDVAAEDAALLSTVPVTSILWPTCFLRSVSDPSRTYEVPRVADAVAPVVPVVPVVVLVGGAALVPVVELEPLPVIAFARI
jgi:hypothetical protein